MFVYSRDAADAMLYVSEFRDFVFGVVHVTEITCEPDSEVVDGGDFAAELPLGVGGHFGAENHDVGLALTLAVL